MLGHEPYPCMTPPGFESRIKKHVLRGYPEDLQGPPADAMFREPRDAVRAAEDLHGCTGVTLSQSGLYELRGGSELKESACGEVTWIKKNAGVEHWILDLRKEDENRRRQLVHC